MITHARTRPWWRPFAFELPDAVEARLPAIGWCVVCFIVVFWRLGYPSFWDPDEAKYAEASREMLASGGWFAPLFNGQPFFDKPFLFYLLQISSFALFGVTETAARVPVAISAVALFAVIAWCGRALFDRQVGQLAALMFAVLPGTFALSSYAILDMTFTAFLFGGVALVVVAALSGVAWKQYAGYALLALAVATKGPVALILSGLAFLLSLAFVPELRARLRGLRLGFGLLLVTAINAPWFFFMWGRFDGAFTSVYALKENIDLYTRPLYGNQPSYFFYTRVMATGLLPWTPLLIGRLVDVARGERLSAAERLLWAWSIAVIGFFSFSRFKLDHYVFPAAPALCLLASHAWVRAHRREGRHSGVIGGAIAVAVVLLVAGVAFVPAIPRVPVELTNWVHIVPVAFMMAGGVMLVRLRADGWRLPPSPILAVAAFLVAYFVVTLIGFPAFERVKPVRGLARRVAAAATPLDRVAMYRMDRWSGSFRFYVGRNIDIVESPEQLRAFLATPGRHYAAIGRGDYDMLIAQGLKLRVLHEQEGLYTTTGHGLSLRRTRTPNRARFVIATDSAP